MSFNQKILDRMQEKHLTKAQLAKAADIPYTTLDSMLKRDSDQKRMEGMLRIAALLGTSIEELVLSDTDFAKSDAFTGEERELMEAFRSLDERGKNTVRALLAHESRLCEKNEPDTAKIIAEQLFDTPAENEEMV